jgi:hypothetical protein
VHGDGLVLVLATDGDFLPADHDHAGVRCPALHGDRLGRRPRGRADRAAALQARGLTRLQRVQSGAQQLAGLGVEEQQRRASSM